MEVDSSAEENRRQSSVSFKDNENKEHAEPTSVSPKVPKKFINNWKQACDRTKDKTKELLKKWRTLPESSNPDGGSVCSQSSEGSSTTNVKIIEMEGEYTAIAFLHLIPIIYCSCYKNIFSSFL